MARALRSRALGESASQHLAQQPWPMAQRPRTRGPARPADASRHVAAALAPRPASTADEAVARRGRQARGPRGRVRRPPGATTAASVRPTPRPPATRGAAAGRRRRRRGCPRRAAGGLRVDPRRGAAQARAPPRAEAPGAAPSRARLAWLRAPRSRARPRQACEEGEAARGARLVRLARLGRLARPLGSADSAGSGATGGGDGGSRGTALLLRPTCAARRASASPAGRERSRRS